MLKPRDTFLCRGALDLVDPRTAISLRSLCRFSFPVSSHIYHMDSIDWNYQNVIQYERNTSYA